MNEKELKTFKATKLRNLKRKKAKLSAHADLTDDYLSISKEIKELENEL